MHGTELLQTERAQETVMAPLLDADDVATILRISPKTVHKLVREGKLSCVQVTTKERRFTRANVQAYIESRTIHCPIDKGHFTPLSSMPKKGGEKSIGVSRADLWKEMCSWQ